MCLKPKLKYENGIYNLLINNKEIKTPEKALFNFKEKMFPELILKEIKFPLIDYLEALRIVLAQLSKLESLKCQKKDYTKLKPRVQYSPITKILQEFRLPLLLKERDHLP